eukprot:CAMPEP_0175312314 /NCGR_PEP_ID=MMETSP0093-20121207/67295_1 /TAXON_ID=311494 /ORGANISM="Alexandrium monilatum, Strain CCMP3105" /LENGTH=39 /DNA_ID= /DNA_START= /DNA_END= /DNA_ORIENTATION=
MSASAAPHAQNNADVQAAPNAWTCTCAYCRLPNFHQTLT